MHGTPAARPPRPATLRDAYAFFLPLIFMAEMMMISHSIIHAFLARLPDPKLTLAAYNVAFSFHSVAGSPVWTAVVTSLAFITDKRSVARLFRFNMIVAIIVSVVTLVLALTPLGHLLFGRLMGASDAVTRDAQLALIVFVFIAPVTVFRSISYALLMMHRRTILITVGTFLRLLSLAGFLAVLPWLLSGASVGAAALCLCIATESVLAVLLAYRFYAALPEESGSVASYRELWRFAWPLMLVQASENGVAFTINFFLGRLAKADLALAAFGVADGLGKLMLGPLRNMAQAAQTLVRTRDDLRTLLVFSAQVVGVFAALMALFYLPAVRQGLLSGVMGLNAEIAGAISPAMLLFTVLAGVIGFSALARGLLMSARITGAIAKAAGWRLLVVIAVGSVSLWQQDLNGAVLGVVALIGGFGVELLVLGARIVRPAEDNPYSRKPPKTEPQAAD